MFVYMSHMTHIEFIGPPGAGKTAISAYLSDKNSGYRPDIEEACRRKFLDRAPLKRRLCYHAMPPPVQAFLDRNLLVFRYRRYARKQFGRQHPEAIQQLLAAVVTAEHQPDKLLRLIQDSTEQYQLGIETAREHEMLYLDEGFGMRAVSALWRRPSAPFSLERYLRHTPTPEVLVYVRAPPDICLSRQENRKMMSIREPWVGEDLHAEQRRFTELCTKVADEQRANTTVITVDNTSTVEDAVDQIGRSLAETLATDDRLVEFA